MHISTLIMYPIPSCVLQALCWFAVYNLLDGFHSFLPHDFMFKATFFCTHLVGTRWPFVFFPLWVYFFYLMFLRSVRLQWYKPICPRFMLLYPKDVCHGSRSSSFPFFYFFKQKEEQKEKLLLPRRRRAEEWKEKSRVAAAAVCKQINRKQNRLQRAGELLHRRARTHSHTHTHTQTHTDTHTHTHVSVHTHTHTIKDSKL